MRIEIKKAGNSSNFLLFLVEATGFAPLAARPERDALPTSLRRYYKNSQQNNI
jgi:hypothetical protein